MRKIISQEWEVCDFCGVNIILVENIDKLNDNYRCKVCNKTICNDCWFIIKNMTFCRDHLKDDLIKFLIKKEVIETL
jgi:hypothetical protein